MTPLELILDKLPDALPCGEGWQARCPAHDDQKPSLSIGEGADGRALLNCHAGCTLEQICDALDLSPGQLFPPSTSTKPPELAGFGQLCRRRRTDSNELCYPTPDAAIDILSRSTGVSPTATWVYRDEAGDECFRVLRFDPASGKTFRPIARSDSGWRIGGPPQPMPLYRLPDLVDADRVYVAEGEKAADAARSIGLTATTSAHGAKAAHKSDWSPLAGKEVILLPDHDAPGQGYADDVARLLDKLHPQPTVRIVELPDLDEGDDVHDWLERMDAREPDKLRAAIEEFSDQASTVTPNVHSEKLAHEPFPVDVLPEPMRTIVSTAAASMLCDPSFVALPMLAALGAAIGNSRRLLIKYGWLVPPIIWTVLIGESGTTKTPAFKFVMRPLRERQSRLLQVYREAYNQFSKDMARWEKEHAAWKRDSETDAEPPRQPIPPTAERILVSDTTVEALTPILLNNPRGVLLARDELAGWLGSFDRYSGGSGADASHWLSMFNAESLTVDRKTGIPPTIDVRWPAVCVTGGIQPGPFHRALGVEHRESGLAARLLVTCPPRAPKRWTDAGISADIERKLANLYERLFEIAPLVGEDEEPRPVVISMTGAARAIWVEFFDAHAREHVELSGELSAVWSKLEEYAARLAMVLHFVRWAEDESDVDDDAVDERSMSAAVTLTRWFGREARRVYAILAESEEDRQQRELLEWIRRKGGRVTVRETQQGHRRFRTSEEARAALQQLVDDGYGHWDQQAPTRRGGRPSDRFVLNS